MRQPPRRLAELAGEAPAESLDRATEADRSDDRRLRSRTAALTEATPGSRSSTLSAHVVTAQHASGRAAVERQQRALRHDPAQPVRRLERHHAAPPIAVGDVQLHALAGRVAQRVQRRPGELGERELLLGGAGRGGSARSPRQKRPSSIAAHQPVLLEGHGQAMGGRPRQTGGVLQTRRGRAGREPSAPQDRPPPLSMTPTPLTLSITRIISQKVRQR